jgi:predicted enzyme related to lactoylglutathione lyase
MSKPKKTVKKKAKAAKAPANIVWFEIPADDVGRARSFYAKLFGWKIKKFPMPMEYYHIDTGGADASPDGGLLKRQQPQQQGLLNYIAVPSVDKYMAKVQKLGGKICVPKTAVPEMGFFAVCTDTENNAFAIWEMMGKGAK